MLLRLVTIYFTPEPDMPTKNEISEFSDMIGKLSYTLGSTHMDAIVHHCETTGM